MPQGLNDCPVHQPHQHPLQANQVPPDDAPGHRQHHRGSCKQHTNGLPPVGWSASGAAFLPVSDLPNTYNSGTNDKAGRAGCAVANGQAVRQWTVRSGFLDYEKRLCGH